MYVTPKSFLLLKKRRWHPAEGRESNPITTAYPYAYGVQIATSAWAGAASAFTCVSIVAVIRTTPFSK